MSSKPIIEPSGESSRPDLIDRTGRLTDQQRYFARVVGHALAKAWRRRSQEADDEPPEPA